MSMGSAGADVRRLDAGTSSFSGSVRLLGPDNASKIALRCIHI